MLVDTEICKYSLTTYMLFIHMQVSAFHLIFTQSQSLDACSSSADLRLFSFVPGPSNRVVQKRKKKEIMSLLKTQCLWIYQHSPVKPHQLKWGSEKIYASVLEQVFGSEILCSSQFSCFKPMVLFGDVALCRQKIKCSFSFAYLKGYTNKFCVT